MARMTGIVLGSGLGALADAVVFEREVAFEDAGLPGASVAGHGGRFVFGALGDQPVVLMLGRVHLYEGHAPAVVTGGIRWMKEQGVERVVLTNAAGTLNTEFKPGDWMMICDQLNLTGASPLQGPEFIDLSAAYDPDWRGEFRGAAEELGMVLCEGVYAGLRGPQYETPAEVRMLQTLGADAVGMSTVLEAIQARSLGMPVVGFSCLTNWGAGISGEVLDHTEVLETGRQAAEVMVRLLERVLGNGL